MRRRARCLPVFMARADEICLFRKCHWGGGVRQLEDLTATDYDDDEQLINEADDEDSHWFPTNTASTTIKNGPPPLLHRRFRAQGQSAEVRSVPPVTPLIAPHKHPLTPTLKPCSTLSPPATPTRCNHVPSILYDSPNNPFLASPLDSLDKLLVEDSDSLSSAQEEKPTMMLVLCAYLILIIPRLSVLMALPQPWRTR